MNKVVIEVNHLGKTFKDIPAVNDLNFTVKQTEFTGILGPNGAGKTTTMKMLYGKVIRDKRTDTSVSVFGHDPLTNELQIKALSGIVPQENNLDTELNVYQNLKVYAILNGISNKELKIRIGHLLEFMELSDRKKAKIRELSGGMKRRLIIARALLNNPLLLILDEPTIGLDPQVRQTIWEKLRLLKKEGVTLLIRTHYMEEAFQLCDNIIIMHKGKKMLEGNPKQIVKDNIEENVLEILDYQENIISSIPSELRQEKTKDRLLLFSNDRKKLEQVAKTINSGNYLLRQSNLEDIFLTITGRGLNE